MIVDIHSHLLYGVDDGPEKIEESILMLEDAKNQGIDAIILTPHYRHDFFPYEIEKIEAHLEELKPHALRVGISLHLGCEYHIDSRCTQYLASGRCRTLAGSRYVLAEYRYDSYRAEIEESVRRLILAGYIPVLAHAERYEELMRRVDYVGDLRSAGALIQINADAVIGLDGRRLKNCAKTLLKNRLVDFIASDSHGIRYRSCHIFKCCDYVCRCYGEDAAKMLFETNPERIIRSAGVL